jgi:hypothetical protein
MCRRTYRSKCAVTSRPLLRDESVRVWHCGKARSWLASRRDTCGSAVLVIDNVRQRGPVAQCMICGICARCERALRPSFPTVHTPVVIVSARRTHTRQAPLHAAPQAG